MDEIIQLGLSAKRGPYHRIKLSTWARMRLDVSLCERIHEQNQHIVWLSQWEAENKEPLNELREELKWLEEALVELRKPDQRYD